MIVRSILVLLLVPVHSFSTLAPNVAAIRQPKVLSSLVLQSSVIPFQNSTTAAPYQDESVIEQEQQQQQQRRAQQVQLAQRSAVAAASCVTTWAMVKYASLSTIQASSLQGLVSCLLFTTPFAAASFCGSFAGMSSHITTWGEASLLGAACAGMFYGWESGKKIQLGKGGRLGTIAFLANVVYLLVRRGSGTMVVDVLNILRPSTAVACAVSGLVLARSSRTNKTKPFIKTDQTLSYKRNYLKMASKVALWSILVSRWLATNGVTATQAVVGQLLPTILCIFSASLVVKMSAGVVLPVALVGLLGSFLGPWAAPIYLGAFVGMTGLDDFSRTEKFWQASLFSAVLLQLGLFHGFGGKLGFLAFLGVNFAL